MSTWRAAGVTEIDQEAIRHWITTYLADVVGVPAKDIDPTVDLENFDLNSASAVSLMGELEDWLGLELSPSLLFEYPTINAVSQYLHDRVRQGAVETGRQR
jgi:acyl carrier protein